MTVRAKRRLHPRPQWRVEVVLGEDVHTYFIRAHTEEEAQSLALAVWRRATANTETPELATKKLKG